MSFYTMAFMGLSPFGSLLSGVLAARIGAGNTLLGGGFLCILAATIFILQLKTLRGVVRPLYIEKGIIEEPVK